jgi:hypothetical protein
VVELFIKRVNDTTYSKLDLYENISLPITYSIADIRYPEQRQGTFTKTISLPGTKQNNHLFNHIFRVNKVTYLSNDFNPSLKASCLILEDSVEIFKGSLKLNDISYLEDGEIIYNCVAFGETTDLFFSLGNKEIVDLFTLTDTLNHVWNRSNIVTSWSATKGQGYIYPMIDYGNHTEITRNTWDTKDFYPAIYVKEYIDRMFSQAGYTYTSDFFDSNRFKSLIIPYNKGLLKKNEDEINRYKAQALISPNKTVNYNLIKISGEDPNFWHNGNYVFKKDIQDNSIYYNNELTNQSGGWVTNTYTAQVQGNYNFNNTLKISGAVVTNAPSGLYNYGFGITITAIFYKNNVEFLRQKVYRIEESHISSQAHTSFPVQTSNVALSIGDSVRVEYYYNLEYYLTQTTLSQSSYIPNFSFTYNQGECVFNSNVLDAILPGDNLKIKNFIPEKVLCKDFLGSIIKMFNLYLEPDKNNPKNLIIEPRDVFYSNETNTLNWSDKVNRNVFWKITPLGELDFKDLIFRYKEDKDSDNQAYQYKYNETYGTRKISVVNDFLTDKKTIEPIFAASPTVVDNFNWNNSRAIPRIINESIGQTASVIRILYYNGLIDSEQWTFIESGNRQAKTQYPYAGMNDSPNLVSFDLCWDIPQELYWDIAASNYLNNNIYNIYYSKMIDEITDVDSKLLEVEVLLNPKDLFEINFAKKIFIDNNYYILNRIIDADRTQTQLCKVELLKLKFGSSYIPNITASFSNARRRNIDIVDGGENIVSSSLNGVPAMVEGGLNEVRNLGATSTIIIVTGGLN